MVWARAVALRGLLYVHTWAHSRYNDAKVAYPAFIHHVINLFDQQVFVQCCHHDEMKLSCTQSLCICLQNTAFKNRATKENATTHAHKSVCMSCMNCSVKARCNLYISHVISHNCRSFCSLYFNASANQVQLCQSYVEVCVNGCCCSHQGCMGCRA